MEEKVQNSPTQAKGSTQQGNQNQDSQNELKHVTWHEAIVGIALILIGIVIILVLSRANVKPVISGTVGTGIDVFAVLYIDAQFIERLVEPFSESSTVNKGLLGSTKTINQEKKNVKDERDNVNAYSNKMSRIQTAHPGQKLSVEDEKSLSDLQDSKTLSEKAIDSANKKIDMETTKRVISFWGLTSLMGMVLVYFTVGIFSTVGLTVSNLTISGTTILGAHGFDAIISGVIVGAGTKPLHDLIGTLQNKSSGSSTGSSSQ